jgi:hypothetical protein
VLFAWRLNVYVYIYILSSAKQSSSKDENQREYYNDKNNQYGDNPDTSAATSTFAFFGHEGSPLNLRREILGACLMGKEVQIKPRSTKGTNAMANNLCFLCFLVAAARA